MGKSKELVLNDHSTFKAFLVQKLRLTHLVQELEQASKDSRYKAYLTLLNEEKFYRKLQRKFRVNSEIEGEGETGFYNNHGVANKKAHHRLTRPMMLQKMPLFSQSPASRTKDPRLLEDDELANTPLNGTKFHIHKFVKASK